MHSANRFGTTWWGRLWIKGLEQLSDDYENRLPRGLKYAEEGAVSHFIVSPGLIEARVHGRKTYTVTLGLPALTQSQWERAFQRLSQESRFVASLLAGEMPQGMDETFRESGASLYPRVPKELQTHCDCPDWANPCKHVAAVCYLVAEQFDRDPFELLAWRGRTREEVLARLRELRGAEVGASAGQEPTPASAIAVRPLKDCVLGFWKAGPELASVQVRPVASEVAGAVLRQLPRGLVEVRGRDLSEVLAPAYQEMAVAAGKRAVGAGA